MLLKCCTQHDNKFWKFSSGDSTGKGQLFSNTKECSNYCTIALISQANKILKARLQQYMSWELPDVQAGFRKGRGTSDQISKIHWVIEKAREFQKNIHFWFIDYTRAFDYMDHNKWWKILKKMGLSDDLTCLLRNLYAAQLITVGTEHGTMDLFQVGKGIHQSYILSPCLFNFYVQYIMGKAGLDEAQLESRLWREISIISDMQMTAP